jgi:hypothetical protein
MPSMYDGQHSYIGRALTLRTRTRNPRFKDVYTGTKRRLCDKKSNRDSGISGSASFGPFNDGQTRFLWILPFISVVGNSPHFWNESPFQTFTRNFNLNSWFTVLKEICMIQPSATHTRFGQTCLFTNSLKFGTTNCG